MMDALISVFVEESKRKGAGDEGDNGRATGYETTADGDDTHVPLTNRRELVLSCLCNKLSKLTLATFDDDGECALAFCTHRQ